MAKLEKLKNATGNFMMAVGAFFLLVIMCMTVLNILYRLFFGKVILGNYELTELMIVVTAGFSMIYAVASSSNVVVKILTARMSPRILKTVGRIIALCGVAVWGLISYGTIWLMYRKGFNEGQTELLEIPMLPLKWIWAFSLVMITLFYLTELFKNSSEN